MTDRLATLRAARAALEAQMYGLDLEIMDIEVRRLRADHARQGLVPETEDIVDLTQEISK